MNATLQRSRACSRLSACGVLLLVFAVSAGRVALGGQEIYQSVDPQGHVIFSDRPEAPGVEPREVPDESLSAPGVMHFCWTNCFTLEAEHGVYSRTDGTDETWTVESFSTKAFVLHRHDAPAAWNRFKADVTYTGQVSNDRLINVTVDGWPVDGIQVAWGSALDTLPGSNAERDGLGAASPPAEPEVAATEQPPPLPDEEQPPCEAAGNVWTPGYWAWNATAYYWIRGTWVLPPRAGVLWTPGYWAFAGGVFAFHRGFWGPRVGYYGGLNYGHGYFGSGYSGGHWVGTRFVYNIAVTNVNTRLIRDTYREPAPANLAASRVAYERVPGRITTLSIPRDRTTSPQPHFTSTRRTVEHAQQTAPSLAATRAVAVAHPARHAAPPHPRVAAPRTLARVPSRDSSRSRPTAPLAARGP